MKKDSFNAKFREYARTLSPKTGERDLVSKIYQSFNNLLGVNNCIQIGSYPRFTSITPVHDLDILYFLGDWSEQNHDPSNHLKDLTNLIRQGYKNPTDYEVKIYTQTHSVTVSYLDSNGDEFFAVDIVPAYTFSQNEFGDDAYKVPEVLRKKHASRVEYYQKLQQEHRDMGWITSDPRGYIKVASDIDQATGGEFRKTVKVIKAWKNNLSESDESLKLKSFHVEQIITGFFRQNQDIEIFDAIFKFFVDLPHVINNPNQMADRANSDKFIDDYLEKFTDSQKEKIKQARDGFLIKLESFRDTDSIEKLMEVYFCARKPSEQFLFDSKIKVLTDPNFRIKIDGYVKPLQGFSAGWISQTPQLQKGITSGGAKTRKIEFSITEDNTNGDEYRWKVKNSSNTDQPRGEITIGQTKNNPEATQFPSESYVECYALQAGVCVAKSKINVKIM